MKSVQAELRMLIQDLKAESEEVEGREGVGMKVMQEEGMAELLKSMAELRKLVADANTKKAS